MTGQWHRRKSPQGHNERKRHKGKFTPSFSETIAMWLVEVGQVFIPGPISCEQVGLSCHSLLARTRGDITHILRVAEWKARKKLESLSHQLYLPCFASLFCVPVKWDNKWGLLLNSFIWTFCFLTLNSPCNLFHPRHTLMSSFVNVDNNKIVLRIKGHSAC